MPDEQGPHQISPQSLGDYLEVMSKAVFQSGISYKVVENKWPGIREAFRGFDPRAVAGLTPPAVEDLVQDQKVIRNRRKIEAISSNARRIIELEKEHGSFKNYLRSHSSFKATVQDLRRQFKFLGESGCYFFLYIVGEEVPPHEEYRGVLK